jgi:beta-xylosidase
MTCSVILALLPMLAGAQTVISKNFSADPSPHYFAGQYYVYATDDQNNSGKYWDSTQWRLLTSPDLKTWKDQGPFMAASIFKWADPGAKAWAPEALEYRGKYYFFAPVGGKQIGVAVSDRPEGPFVDVIGKPLVETPRDANAGAEPIDPAVFVDKDGRIYLYFGTRTPKVVELAPDLSRTVGTIRDVVVKGMPEKRAYGEAPFLHAHRGLYYFSFSTGWPGQIVYATASSPLGPFTYKGVLIDYLKISTNHQAILERDGRSYLFYHDAVLPGGGSFKRSILVEEIEYDADGKMRRIAGPLRAPWVADLGDGRYRNPVLHADYADPDAIRVGDMYYMVSSSFNNTPGLPLLQSSDLVNWELVGHALPALPPASVFAVPQPGKGVWAPALRHHAGKFWIFYPDPDFGVYVMTADRFAGPWSEPHLLLAGKGIIDPAPLWDDDGKAWLVHGWAKSRSGINNILTLRSMNADATALLDARGKDIINGDLLPGYHTIEGPKLYKVNGYYYVFAPAGGVEQGWQSVFRSRSIEGPYEDRIVMARGTSPINGPHQGAWVDGMDGKDWFLHFQDKGAYGRVVHLQPMRWRDGWPVIGAEAGQSGVGEPVESYDKPAGRDRGVLAPPTGDEFASPRLGLQWQWNANPARGWHALDARRCYLRLYAQPAAGSVRMAPSVLTQKFPAPAFTVETKLEPHGTQLQRAGLVVLGVQYAWLGLRQSGGATQLALSRCETPALACMELIEPLPVTVKGPVYLRARVEEGALVQFSYSLDGVAYTPAGKPFQAVAGRWVGAQIGLMSLAAEGVQDHQSFIDVDYFRVGR